MRSSSRAPRILIVTLPSTTSSGPLEVDPGALVLKSGRPLLAIADPAKWHMPERALVAWKDTREARRAVADALPFLAAANTVRIVEFVEDESNIATARKRAQDVAAWLAGHGIKASVAARRPLGQACDEIEAAAEDIDADLIVAGAYGRTRLGEWMFGGVTRHLLKTSRRPLLLAH